jgi:hypothetical protein
MKQTAARLSFSNGPVFLPSHPRPKHGCAHRYRLEPEYTSNPKCCNLPTNHAYPSAVNSCVVELIVAMDAHIVFLSRLRTLVSWHSTFNMYDSGYWTSESHANCKNIYIYVKLILQYCNETHAKLKSTLVGRESPDCFKFLRTFQAFRTGFLPALSPNSSREKWRINTRKHNYEDRSTWVMANLYYNVRPIALVKIIDIGALMASTLRCETAFLSEITSLTELRPRFNVEAQINPPDHHCGRCRIIKCLLALLYTMAPPSQVYHIKNTLVTPSS